MWYLPRESHRDVSGLSKDTNWTDSDKPTPLQSRASGPLTGKVRVPGDKSISHRALILGALAVGETRISGLLEGEDVLNTAKSMQALGAKVERTGDFAWKVNGVGVAGFAAPKAPLDFGNSGTGCRLVMGAVAGCPITATFDGDASLRSRPMRRGVGPPGLLGGGGGEAKKGGGRPWANKNRAGGCRCRCRAHAIRCRSFTAPRWPRRRSNRPCCWRDCRLP